MKIKFSGVLLSMALMFAIMLGFVPGIETAMTVHAADDSGVCIYCNNIAWELDGNTLTISKADEASSGKMCGQCDSGWYSHRYIINDVIIEEGVTSIESNLFYSGAYMPLKSVIIPNSVTSIGEYAFGGCSNLSSVTIPDSVTSIGCGAFSRCENLVSINIPDSVTSIEDSTFYGCSNLSNITIPNNVTNIGSNAFDGCSSLSSIIIPKTVVNIGEYAFNDCSSLSGSIEIPLGVTSIDNAFSGCSSLTGITVPNSVTSIDGAFSGCSSLTGNITIPTGVTNIGDGTFMSCSGLTSITIPEGVTSIGFRAFYGCSGLTNITIPTGVTSIGTQAFSACSNLTAIIIPDGVTSIENGVFSGCSSLSSITLPAGVTIIGPSAFSSCESLTSITLPSGVTSIGSGAFSWCSKLTSITIPVGVTSIENRVFEQCFNLASVTMSDEITNIGELAFYACYRLEDVVIPTAVTSIGEDAFGWCRSLTNITIPDGVTSIGKYAFSFNDSLTIAKVPCRLKSLVVENSVFADCAPTVIYVHPQNACVDNETTDTLTLTCPYCSNTYTATLKAPTQTTYTGKPIEVTCTGISDDFAPTITYSGNKLVDGKPVYPGTYTATLTYGDKKVSLKYTIEEAVAPAPAKPNKITNVVSGVHVYWPAVSGTSKYGLWRSETGVNGTYKWIANPTVAHFTDTKVTSGKTYYYKVTTMDTVNNVHSAKSAAMGITYVATPDITKRENKAAGIVLNWNKITGATGYAIYRKPYSGNADWVRVATINSPSTLTWTDTSVKTNNGGMYKYTIRALAGSNSKTLSGCRGAGRTMVRLTSRTLSSATKATATSIKCSWSTTSYATGYEVRFMVGSTVYKTFTVGNYKTGVKTFTGLKAGQTYKIQVRAYKKVEDVGTLYSAWSTPKTVSL